MFGDIIVFESVRNPTSIDDYRKRSVHRRCKTSSPYQMLIASSGLALLLHQNAVPPNPHLFRHDPLCPLPNHYAVMLKNHAIAIPSQLRSRHACCSIEIAPCYKRRKKYTYANFFISSTSAALATFSSLKRTHDAVGSCGSCLRTKAT